MNLLAKTILGTDIELRDAHIPTEDPLVNFRERVEQQSLQKSLPGVTDERWDAPMGDVVQECFEKAFLSAAGAMAKFLEKHSHTSGPLPWEELRKSFREERQQCRR